MAKDSREYASSRRFEKVYFKLIVFQMDNVHDKR